MPRTPRTQPDPGRLCSSRASRAAARAVDNRGGRTARIGHIRFADDTASGRHGRRAGRTGTSRRGLALLLALGIAATGAGCGIFGDGEQAADTPGRSASPDAKKSASASARPTGIPDPNDVDFDDPQAVCDAFADTLFSGNPSTEAKTEPLRRAERYVTAAYKQPFSENSPRLYHWEEWGDAGATSLSHTPMRHVGHPPENGTSKTKQGMALRRVVPRDSAGNPVSKTYAFQVSCIMRRSSGDWRVGDHSQSEIDP